MLFKLLLLLRDFVFLSAKCLCSVLIGVESLLHLANLTGQSSFLFVCFEEGIGRLLTLALLLDLEFGQVSRDLSLQLANLAFFLHRLFFQTSDLLELGVKCGLQLSDLRLDTTSLGLTLRLG